MRKEVRKQARDVDRDQPRPSEQLPESTLVAAHCWEKRCLMVTGVS